MITYNNDKRKEELIACCKGIIRNADKITEELELNQGVEVKIMLYPREVPTVEITKKMFPKEVIEVWNMKNEKE